MGTFIVNAGNLWINDTRVIGWESDKNAKSELTFETRTKFRPFIISWGGSVLNAAKSQFQNLGFSGGKGYGLSYRSEEHTSELQSLMRISYTVLRLQKKTKKHINNT